MRRQRRMESRSAVETNVLGGSILKLLDQVAYACAARYAGGYVVNRFTKPDPRLVYTFFLSDKPPADAATTTKHRADEEIHAGKRELYVYYPQGMGRSKLVIPAAARGTARNINTVAKLAAMSAA